MYKILFVCLGNLCRSPTAEGIMHRLLEERNAKKDIFVDSAATNSASKEGDAPDYRAVECAKKYGIDLSQHKTRPLKVDDFAKFDLVLAMDEKSLKSLKQICPPRDNKYNAVVKKLLEYAPELGTDVPDPYFDCTFEESFEVLEKACKGLLKGLNF